MWAGWHNLRERKLAMQKARENQVVLIPDKQGQAGSEGEDELAPKMRGKKAPTFVLTNLEGKKVSLADYKGRPVLVNFWATWCGPCKVEMPWFEELRKQYAAQGFEILGLADDADAGKDAIAKVAQQDGSDLSDPVDGWKGADRLRRPRCSADVVLCRSQWSDRGADRRSGIEGSDRGEHQEDDRLGRCSRRRVGSDAGCRHSGRCLSLGWHRVAL